MPRRDGSGPQGAGQMSGRRAGYCAGVDAPGVPNDGAEVGKRGCRRGGGFGAGHGAGQHGQHGNRFQFKQTGLSGRQRAGAASNPAAEQDSRVALQQRAQELQAELGRINTLLEQPAGE